MTVLLHGRSVFAGSNAFADRIDELQYGLEEGPCVSALVSARVVRTSSVGAGERRWPRFTPVADALELRSAFSSPVLAGDAVIGSLNLYGRAPDSFAAALPTIRSCSEDVARSVGALHLQAMAEVGLELLAEAVTDRLDADLAVGLLMGRYTMGASAARVLLAQLARLDGVSVGDAARSLTRTAAR